MLLHILQQSLLCQRQTSAIVSVDLQSTTVVTAATTMSVIHSALVCSYAVCERHILAMFCMHREECMCVCTGKSACVYACTGKSACVYAQGRVRVRCNVQHTALLNSMHAAADAVLQLAWCNFK